MATDISLSKVKLELTHERKKYNIFLESHDGPLTLEDLAEQTEQCTDVPICQQRLIFKGKSLCDMNSTISSLGLKDGSKVMLIGKKFNAEDEGHLKVMTTVDSNVNATQNKLNELESEYEGIEKGFLASELQEEAVKKLSYRLGVVIENFTNQIEQLDCLSLSKSTNHVQNKRKIIVQRIQKLLQQADTLQTNLSKLKEGTT